MNSVELAQTSLSGHAPEAESPTEFGLGELISTPRRHVPSGGLRSHRFVAGILGVCVLLASCDDPNRKIGVEVSGYNHMPAGSWSIAAFRVFGGSGPNLSPETGGGAFNCCAEVPARWRPGLKAKVEWSYAGRQDGPEPPPPQEAIVDVPDYGDNPGPISVNFYAGHRVLVVIGPYGIQHPKYNMSEVDKLPWQTRKDLIERQPEKR